jgi:hypothetical protein
MIIDPNLEQETPLAFRMIENIPGISASIGFGMMRGSNTMMYGGFMDDSSSLLRSRRAKRYATMSGGKLSTPGAGGFYGGVRGGGILGRRAQTAAAANKTPFLRSARLNNITARPRALTRFHSMSVFSGAQGVYTPFAASSFLGNTKFGKSIVEKTGMQLKEGEKAFGPGMFSAITAGVKVDRLERKALSSGSKLAKLERVDSSLKNLMSMNKPSGLFFSGGEFGRVLPKSLGQGMMLPAGQTAMYSAAGLGGVTGAGAGNIGVRGNMMASSLTGAVTSYGAGYARGALGFGGVSGLTGRALTGAQAAEGAFGRAVASFGDEGFKLASGKVIKGADEAVSFLRSTGAGGSLFKQLGAKGTMALARSGGGAMLATRAAAMAIPGLNLIATASLVYDLGKMGGELIKSGINFARDANRSLQGSIAKPAFGMGYKDTEAAATSRARGVMAIQNSRLNARSMLGTEGAMMAAHYG